MSAAAQRWALAAWLALVLACVLVISRITITTDISALLPRSPTALQQVLVEQLRGVCRVRADRHPGLNPTRL
jgi:predicted exporter